MLGCGICSSWVCPGPWGVREKLRPMPGLHPVQLSRPGSPAPSIRRAGLHPLPLPRLCLCLLLRDPSPLLPSLGTPSGQGDGVAALTWCRAGVRVAGHPRRTLASVLRVSLSLHLEARPPPGPQPCPGPGPPQASLHLEAVPPVCGRACVTQSRDETRKRGRGRASRSFLASPFPTAEGAWRGPHCRPLPPSPRGPGPGAQLHREASLTAPGFNLWLAGPRGLVALSAPGVTCTPWGGHPTALSFRSRGWRVGAVRLGRVVPRGLAGLAVTSQQGPGRPQLS